MHKTAPVVAVEVEVQAPVVVAEVEVQESVDQILWDSKMKKADLLEVAHEAGLSELSSKNTKVQISDALTQAGYSES